jgi:hypothetical protein
VSTAPYWPWWLAAASLAVVTVGCCIVARRPLGVSGILARFTNFREELEAERRRRALAAREAELEAALLAATAEAFATLPDAPAGCGSIAGASPGSAADASTIAARRKGCAECTSPASRPSLATHAVFLAAIVLGGFAVQLSRGGWRATADMGPTFARLFGAGPRAALVLAAGGVLVGLGTSISGGCSTGHGLSGCSRLQPAGVTATVSFMCAAVLVAFLLQRSLS